MWRSCSQTSVRSLNFFLDELGHSWPEETAVEQGEWCTASTYMAHIFRQKVECFIPVLLWKNIAEPPYRGTYAFCKVHCPSGVSKSTLCQMIILQAEHLKIAWLFAGAETRLLTASTGICSVWSSGLGILEIALVAVLVWPDLYWISKSYAGTMGCQRGI